MWARNCGAMLAVLLLAGASEVPESDDANFPGAAGHEHLDESSARAGCSVPIADLSDNSPLFIIPSTGALITPNGTTGLLDFNAGQAIMLVCPGNELIQPYTTERPEEETLVCVGGYKFSNSYWYPETVELGQITCSCSMRADVKKDSTCQPASGVSSTRLRVGVPNTLSSTTFNVYTACFTSSIGRVEYVTYSLNPENLVTQNVSAPAVSFQQGEYFPNLTLFSLYSQGKQLQNFNAVLGFWIGSLFIFKGSYLVPGQLAASSDFVFHSEQKTTFQYINTAPQWIQFNNGNWGLLEQSLRKRIGALEARTTVYSGTWGILKLKSDDGNMEEMYLQPAGKKLPIPLYFYKVVVDVSTKRATAFVGVNNPYVIDSEIEELTFCTDFCSGSNAFKWLEWNQQNKTMGYSFCCELNDFQNTVKNLPTLTSSGLFV